LRTDGGARSHTYFRFINSDGNLYKSSHISNKCTWHCVRKGKFNRTKLRYELWWPLLMQSNSIMAPAFDHKHLLYLPLQRKHHNFMRIANLSQQRLYSRGTKNKKTIFSIIV
jgi:hypothetical protein